MTGNPNQPNATTTPEALEMARRKREEKEKRRLAFEAARASLLSSSDAAQPQGKHAPLTRQERREIQEKQRAEKEARKQGLVLLRKDTDSIDERPQRQERGDVGGMPFFQGCPPTLHITETSSQSNFPGSVASSHGPSPPNNSSCTSGNVMMRLVSIDRTRNVHSGTSGNKRSPSENSLGGPGGSAVAQTMIHSSHIHASPTHSPLSSNFLHPAIYQLGIWFRENYILGSNARCTALLLALRAWMTSLVHQQQNATSSPRFDYDAFVATRKPLSQQLTYLTSVRRLSVGMGNAIRLMKQESFKMARKGMSELEVYQALCEFVDTFIQEKIHCFQYRDRLDKFCAPLVENGEVILTYGHCSIIRHLLLRCACEYQRRFHVIIVDAPPLHEGRSLLEALRGQSNLDITYCYLTSMSNTMPHVTKVFLGASAVTSNGEIHSRSGTALVAMTAKHHHLPVIVFCETYKFAHRAWLGSLTHNEQGQRSGLGGFTQYMYDLTPIQFVDVVITEYGPTPPMNIATVVREKEGEDITGNVM